MKGLLGSDSTPSASVLSATALSTTGGLQTLSAGSSIGNLLGGDGANPVSPENANSATTAAGIDGSGRTNLGLVNDSVAIGRDLSAAGVAIDANNVGQDVEQQNSVRQTGSIGAPIWQSNLNALTASLATLPSVHDRERKKNYVPRNPYVTPAAFFDGPGPSPVFDDPAIFEKFNPDTLFFIFYYQQGTYQQYLAAKELKKQSWRFHKK